LSQRPGTTGILSKNCPLPGQLAPPAPESIRSGASQAAAGARHMCG
jgi:hypothetical protein